MGQMLEVVLCFVCYKIIIIRISIKLSLITTILMLMLHSRLIGSRDLERHGEVCDWSVERLRQYSEVSGYSRKGHRVHSWRW